MEISLRYVTRFHYQTPVWESQNALRACPRRDGFQRLSDYRLTVDPAAKVMSYWDRWGNQVDLFGVREPHDRLTVTADARVETDPRPEPPAVPVSALTNTAYREPMWSFLQPGPHTRWEQPITDAAEDAVAGVDDVAARVRAVAELVFGSIDYTPGATEIGVSVADVWENRRGVCQDYSHVTIAMLRSLGIGARYVSGYFYAADPAAGDDPAGEEITVQTHAWVSAAIPGWGWWDIDPTNGSPVGERHVVIGHGRDYDDLTPLRGVYFGETDHLLVAGVAMRTGPLAPNAPARLTELQQQQIQQ